MLDGQKKVMVLMTMAAMTGISLVTYNSFEAERARHEAEMERLRQESQIDAAAYERLNAQFDAIKAEMDKYESIRAEMERERQERQREAEAGESSRGAGRVITVTATAYTTAADECGKDDGITASGRRAIPYYTVASDDLPIGTRLLIDGQPHEVMDTFGGSYTGRIDINVPTKAEAWAYGKRQIRVEVLE